MPTLEGLKFDDFEKKIYGHIRHIRDVEGIYDEVMKKVGEEDITNYNDFTEKIGNLDPYLMPRTSYVNTFSYHEFYKSLYPDNKEGGKRRKSRRSRRKARKTRRSRK